MSMGPFSKHALCAATLALVWVSPLPAQFTGHVGGRLEGWLDQDGGYNSRVVADLVGGWRRGRVQIDAYYGFRYWTAADAATILNAEAGRSLERVHGLTATYRVAMCRIGGWIGRRAILTLGTEEVWGQTIGYYDGVAPLASCTFGPVTVEAHGPLERYQPLTLPWPLYEATVRYQKGVWRVEAYSSIGGPQAQAYDLHVEVGKTLRAGVYAGRLAAPVAGDRITRVAVAVSVGQ